MKKVALVLCTLAFVRIIEGPAEKAFIYRCSMSGFGNWSQGNVSISSTELQSIAH